MSSCKPKYIKFLLLFVITAVFLNDVFSEDLGATLVGEWKLTQEEDNQDYEYIESTYINFFEDGSFYSSSASTIKLKVDKDILTLNTAGPDKGIWKIKDNKLIKAYKKSRVDYFYSEHSEITLEAFKKELESPETSTYKIVKFTREKIRLKEIEDGSISELTRINPENAKKELDVKFYYPLNKNGWNALWGEPSKASAETVEGLFGQHFRRNTLFFLEQEEFKCSKSLPHLPGRPFTGELRPEKEILNRLIALYTVVFWVSTTEEELKSEILKKIISSRKLESFLTNKEKNILALSRDKAKKEHQDSIGWKIENMWSLAWVLGFEHPPTLTHGHAGEEIQVPLYTFLGKLIKNYDKGKKNKKMRSIFEVRQLEDLFYCGHNAVRSAQLGTKEAVPKGFHPIYHGGTVHERRHALTWVLSPKTSWDKTDLST